MNKIYRLFRYDLPMHFVLLLTNWLPDNVFCLRLRGALARPFFGSCGPNLRLGRGLTFYNPAGIHIGRDVYIAYGCWFMAGEKIAIGDEVLFGPYCVTVSANHTRYKGSFRYGEAQLAPIQIGRGSWIAAHVTITAGSQVGAGSLVAAGAVVAGEIPENVLAGGAPARALKQLETESLS